MLLSSSFKVDAVPHYPAFISLNIPQSKTFSRVIQLYNAEITLLKFNAKLRWVTGEGLSKLTVLASQLLGYYTVKTAATWLPYSRLTSGANTKLTLAHSHLTVLRFINVLLCLA